MAQFLKQSTAYTFRLGPFVDSTDGVTAETALTLTQADFRLSKAGAAFAQKNETTSGTHDENGYYTCILNTTDTNTVGPLRVHVSETGALPVWMVFTVLPAQVYDSLIGGTDLLDVSVAQNAGTAITAASGIQEVKVASIAANAITATSINADAITDAKVASDVTIASVTGAVGSVTGNVGGNVTGSVGSLGVQAKADVNAEVDTAITDAALATAANLAAVPTANANADALLDRAAGVETNRTLRQALRLMLSAMVGKASGLATTTAVYRDTNDTVDRLVATVDADGNRSAVTLDAS